MKLFLYVTDEKKLEINNNYDLIMRTNNTNVLDCWFIDDDDDSIVITGATIFFTIKSKTTDLDTAAILKKDITTLTDSAAGEAKITLTSTDTASLLGNYIYDIKIKLSTGEIYTCAEGTITFRKSLSTRTS